MDERQRRVRNSLYAILVHVHILRAYRHIPPSKIMNNGDEMYNV